MKKTTEIAVEAFAYAKKELLEVARHNKQFTTKTGVYGMEGDDPFPCIQTENDFLRLVVMVHERESTTEYLVDILEKANSLPELLLLMDSVINTAHKAKIVKICKDDE